MTLAIVTPSHAPDFIGFSRLHASVLRNCASNVRHVVVVPDTDVSLFESLGSAQLTVVGYSAILPRRFVSTTPIARIPKLPRGFRVGAVNITRPWPPIRGWILQQLVKLVIVSQMTEDTVLLIDSDVVLIRRVDEGIFRKADQVVRLFRRPGGITPDMTRHIRWQATARGLLGSPGESDAPDYISAFSSWDPNLVRGCIEAVQARQRRGWQDTIASRLEFSEFLLYGNFVMTLADPRSRSFVSDESLCHSHWDRTPLTPKAVPAFVAGINSDDVAIHVQSNSGTADEVVELITQGVNQKS